MPVEDYEKTARFYDPLLNPFLDSLRKDVAQHMAATGAYRVLDLCCGTGRQALFLREAGMEVMGVDLSPAMLHVARESTPADIVFHHADASSTGLTSTSFDAVLLSLALHELPETLRQAILTEAHRLLHPSGTLMILDYRRPDTPAGHLLFQPIRMVERLAGHEHYEGFKDFMAGGATIGLLERSNSKGQLLCHYFQGCIGLYAL